MFEYLATYPHIIVTGPQRSGTTIAAAMIAYDLGYWFYPEEQVRVWERPRVMRELRKRKKCVLQLPALCHAVHTFSAPDIAIVLVRRDLDAIHASEKRVNWEGQWRELARYGLKEGDAAKAKYDYWDRHQKALIHNAYELDYESLQAHPMWLSKEERAGFGPRQYGHTNDCATKYRFRPEQVWPGPGAEV